MNDPRDFLVGYKRPPVHAHFKSGQSGNPRGRPKKTSVTSELAIELNRKVTVRENGLELKMTKAAALAKSLVARAMGGDMRAIGHLIRLLPAQFQAPADVADKKISEIDAAALERFVERRLAVINEPANTNVNVTTHSPKKDATNE